MTANTALTTEAIWSHRQITARPGRALLGFFHPAADYEILWDITRLPTLRPLLTHVSDGPRKAQVEWVLDRFEARVAPALPGLRVQVTHGDMGLDNVLLGDDLRVSGIVDFGDMTHAPLVCDLAVAVADVLHGRDDAIEAADALIGGYVSVTPLDDEEAGLLADLVAARLATEVAVTAWRQRLYPDNVAYAASGEPGAALPLPKVCYQRSARAPPSGAAPIAAVLLPPGASGPRRGCLVVRPRRPAVPRLLQQRGRGRAQPPKGRAGGDAAAAAARDPQPLSARGDRRARRTAPIHPAAGAGRRHGRELRQRGQRLRLADRPRGHRVGRRDRDRLRLPRAAPGSPSARKSPGWTDSKAKPTRCAPSSRRCGSPRTDPQGAADALALVLDGFIPVLNRRRGLVLFLLEAITRDALGQTVAAWARPRARAGYRGGRGCALAVPPLRRADVARAASPGSHCAPSPDLPDPGLAGPDGTARVTARQ